MTLIEKAKISHECAVCGNAIELGEPYLQSVKSVGAGMAIVGIHAEHIAHNNKNLKHLGNRQIKTIENICSMAVELVNAGASIPEAIKESKKIYGWSDWL